MMVLRYCPFALLIWPLLCDGGSWICALVCVGLPLLAACALFAVFSIAGALHLLAQHTPRMMR